MLSYVILPLFLLHLTTESKAHGDYHERILKATKEIATHPDSAFLYLKRGKLYFHHEAYDSTLLDLKQATKLGYQDTYCKLLYAKTYQKLSNFEEALLYVSQLEAMDSSNVAALKTKAQIYRSQSKFELAATTFEQVIKKTRRTLPENYIETATAWEQTSTEKGWQRAAAILQQGIKNSGPLFTLLLPLKDLYLKKKDFKEALAVQQDILRMSPRKETGYYDAAIICMELADLQEAAIYARLGLSAIDQLPTRAKSTIAMKRLQQDLKKLQEEIVPE